MDWIGYGLQFKLHRVGLLPEIVHYFGKHALRLVQQFRPTFEADDHQEQVGLSSVIEHTKTVSLVYFHEVTQWIDLRCSDILCVIASVETNTLDELDVFDGHFDLFVLVFECDVNEIIFQQILR